MTDPLVGTTVAHYEVLGKLGGGGMGIVYTARNVRLGQVVALKFLPPQWSHDESAKQRFLREAQAASATNHRNICTIHDIETAPDGQLFIVMAYYEGQTLKQKLEAGALPVEEAVEIAAQVAEGLAKAHNERIVHRDIKPGNLMLVDGDVKILDFGLAKFANALQLTLEGSTLGTIAYMSPEQTRGEEADARSDVWSLGVVLYEMLAGALPFKGAYPEAVSHAIRNDPIPAIRNVTELPSQLLAILDRALQKDPAARYQNARELARDLRLLQGRTIPLDLITGPIHAPALQLPPRKRWWRTRTAAAAAALVLLIGISVPVWLFAPVNRVPVVLVPVVNQTGYAELDAYRPALTAELIADLTDSRTVQVLSYDRELQILRRFNSSGQDMSSRDAIQALAANSAPQLLIAPTLLYENGAFRVRVSLIDPKTATNRAARDTAPLVSALPKDGTYGLVPTVRPVVDAYFVEVGPLRLSARSLLRSMLGDAPESPLPRFRSLDAAAAFERGLDSYAQQELGMALSAFTQATELDPQNPLAAAWRSRVARMMRRDDEASEAGRQAERLLTTATRPAQALFVRAIAAESRRDFTYAESQYRELVRRYPDDPTWKMELAGLLDRQLRADDAVAAYYDALQLDERLVRPHLELCRLYGPFRLNDPPKAKQEGQVALDRYRALTERAGEAQSLWCLADVLNVGTEQDRAASRQNADEALRIFAALKYPYNLSRAYNYVALAANAQGRYADAATFWEQSLASAKEAGNVGLQPALLTNLAIMHRNLGDRSKAVALLKEGYRGFETLGDQQRAAQNQANAASLVVEYGGKLDEGVRDVRNALSMFEKLGDKDFQVFCLQVLAGYYRNAGRQADAERELNRAMSLARTSNLEDEIARITIDLARVRIELSDYAAARTRLQETVGDGTAPDADAGRLYLALAELRLGDLDAARSDLDRAAAELDKRKTRGRLAPLLERLRGELDYEAGEFDAARKHFAASSDMWTRDLPDAASVESRAYVGFLDAMRGEVERGRAAVATSLAQAQAMGRFTIEARCRVFLAQIDVQRRRPDEALAQLGQIASDDDARTIGRELRALVHHGRAQALMLKGDNEAAQTAFAEARKLVDTIRAPLPAAARAQFDGRRSIRLIGT